MGLTAVTDAAAEAASVRRGDAAGYDVDEVLQVAGGPALEGAVAVALVGGHYRVAVVPVEPRLGVEPEEAAGPLRHLGEDLGVRLAAVGAGVADVSGYTDYGRVWLEFLTEISDELDPRSTVIVLGDARTNGREPHAEVFAQVAERAGRLFWLNPCL